MKNENYIMIMGWMIRVVGLAPGAEREIYAIIHGFCQDGKSEFLGSLKYLSDFSGYGRTTVINTLSKMYLRGDLIKRVFYEKDGQKRCAYVTTISRLNVAASSLTADAYKTLISRYKNNSSQNIGCTKTEPEEGSNSEPLRYKKCTFPSTKFEPNISSDRSKYKTSSSAAEESDFTKKIDEIFGRNPFDKNFIDELKSCFSEYGIEESRAGEYIDSVYKITLEHKPKSVTNFFRKIATSSNVLQDFVMKKADNLKMGAAKSWHKFLEDCPVCGERTSKFCSCKKCEFDMTRKTDSGYVEEKRRIFALPAEKKAAYETECSRLYTAGLSCLLNPKKQAEHRQKERAIKIKYGIISEGQS